MKLIDKIAKEKTTSEKARRAAVSVGTRAVEGLFVGEILGRSRKGAILGAALGGVTGALDEFFRRRAEEHRKKTQAAWAKEPHHEPDQAPGEQKWDDYGAAASRRRR